MSASDSGNLFAQIESICREFRRELKKCPDCRIEDYVSRITKSARATLFQQLLLAELTFRQQRGQLPSSGEYIRRFPQHEKLIRQAFYEPSVSSSIGSSEPSSPSLTLTAASVSLERFGDYEVVRELGRGGFGIVYEARHIRRNDWVALKTLQFEGQAHPLRDADRLHKFRREFRSLSETNHRHLVGMQTLEFDEERGLWFFTMELVRGCNFLEYVRADGKLDESRLRAVLPQLVEGIAALHARHIVHRDLKPSNVMVDDSGRVVILDFGLATELQQRIDETMSANSRQFAGTMRYAAPEQLSGSRLAASDWYAMGVMIYETMTGVAPFSGAPADLIVQKKTLDPPSLSERQDLPADLTSLVDQLLKRDPDQRPDQSTIVSLLSTACDSSIAEPEERNDSSIGGPVVHLVGRESQLTELEAIREEWNDGRCPMVVFVSGRSGEGKTSLIEQFLRTLRRDRKTLIFTGRCYDRESVPYKAIDGWIDALVVHLRARQDQDVSALLPQDADILAHLFPVTRRVPEIARLDQTLVQRLDPKQIRQRAFQALKELLHRICETTPLVLFVDDLQWGDADSASVIVDLLSPPDPPACLLLGSYRSDEAENSPFLNQWRTMKEQIDSPSNLLAEMSTHVSLTEQNVSVGPLSEDQCVQFVISRLGDDRAVFRERAVEIFRSTGGNPYLIEQLIQCLDLETGSLSVIPLGEVIARRLSQLPEEAKPLLEVISVAGHSFAANDAADAIGLTTPVFATLNRMRNERLVRLMGSDPEIRVDTFHDKIREATMERLDERRRRELHRRLGETIERLDQVPVEDLLTSIEVASHPDDTRPESPPRVYDLAHHFCQAGVERKALLYSLLAGEHAKAQFALAESLRHYATAVALSQRCSRAVRYRVIAGLASIQLLAGRYADAYQTLDRAIELADSQRDRITARTSQAEIIYKTGSLTDCIYACEALLRDLGVRVPRSRGGLLWAVAWNWLGERLAPLFPIGRERPEDAWKTDLTIRIFHRMTYPAWFCVPLRAIWASSVGFAMTRQSKDPSLQVLMATVKSVTISWVRGAFGEARKLSDNAFVIASGHNDISLQAHVHCLRAGAHLNDFEEMLRASEMGRELYTRVGDAWRETYSYLLAGDSLAQLGVPGQSIALCSQAFQAAISLRQHRLAQTCVAYWGNATDGRLPFALLRSRFKQVEDDLATMAGLHTAESAWHGVNGRSCDALESAERAIAFVQRLRPPMLGMLWPFANPSSRLALPNHARALRWMAESSVQEAGETRSEWYRKALRAANRAVRVEKRGWHNLPFALRELSLAYAGLGRTKKAFRYARKSLQSAEAQNAKYQYAASFLVVGQLGKELGKPEADEQIREAEAKLAEFEREIAKANRKAIEFLGMQSPDEDGVVSETSL